jgi:hypothetical protein
MRTLRRHRASAASDPASPPCVTDAARIAFAWAVSLLPGTVAAVLGDEELTIHAIDRTLPVRERLLELERRVADVFVGEEIDG